MILEQIEAGTVETRRHVNLPLNSKIEWPYNQQVRYVRQRDIKRHKKSEIQTKEGVTHSPTKEEKDSFSQASSSYLAPRPELGEPFWAGKKEEGDDGTKTDPAQERANKSCCKCAKRTVLGTAPSGSTRGW